MYTIYVNTQKIYIKKLEEIGKHTVWLVDGEYIRKNLNENFVEYDQHYHLSFIPKNEFWIDHLSNPKEHFFFINHMINEQWEIEQGKTYDEAMKRADELEKRERMKLTVLDNPASHEKLTKEELIKSIHKHKYTEYSKTGDVHIWIVDGKLVRDHLLVDFADGGHDRVYPFIPHNEIWLEDCLSKKECDFILLHELHERFLMGEGKDYAHAHRGATVVEDYYRDHPENITERINEEIQKNNL